jgi:hypothetical protein
MCPRLSFMCVYICVYSYIHIGMYGRLAGGVAADARGPGDIIMNGMPVYRMPVSVSRYRTSHARLLVYHMICLYTVQSTQYKVYKSSV